MMVDMRHMGNSGKFGVIAGMVAAALLILTGMTLAEPVFLAFLATLALAYLACIAEVIRRRRYLMLAVAAIATSLAVAGSLAFLSAWELAFEGQPSLFGTPLPTNDPDNYFFLAALSLVTALAALFAGAVWPGTAASRTAASRAAAPRPRASSGSGTQARQPASSARKTPQRQVPQGPANQKRRAPKPAASRQSTAKQPQPRRPVRRPAPKR